MEERICCFCGPKKIVSKNCISEIHNIIYRLIEYEGVTIFYSAHLGKFDICCENAVSVCREKYPRIKLCWVTPYITAVNCDCISDMFDEIIIPKFDNFYHKQSEKSINRWMALKSDVMLYRINSRHDNAFEMLRYGKILGLELIKCGE